MSGWAMTLDVSDVFHREGMATVDKAKAIAARIQTHRWADSNGFVCDLADELAEQTDPDAFDVICGSGIGDELTKKASRGQKAEIIHKAMGQLSGNGNAESLKWMEDTGFLLEEGYRFGDNDYERQPYVSPRSIRQEQEKQNQTA